HFERSRRVEQLSPAASLSTESNPSVFHQAVTDLTVAPQCPGCGRAQRGKQHRREKDHSPYHVRRVARPTDSGTAERQEQSAGWNGSTTSTRFVIPNRHRLRRSKRPTRVSMCTRPPNDAW